MKGRKDGQLVLSDSYILTINNPNMPPQIKVGFLISDTKVYILNPQRCFNCQKYGHNNRYCKNQPKYAKCAQAEHDDYECENEAKCANCNSDHPARTRSYSKWKIEKEIIKVKYQKIIPFHEAKQQVEGPITDPSKKSYATASKSHNWTSNIKPPNTLSQNKQSTSSASQLCEITLPASASEHTNESRKLNSAFAIPLNIQHDTSAAQSDDINTTTQKRPIHEVTSEEDPISPLPTKGTAPDSLDSEQNGTFVPKGAGRAGLSKISTLCLTLQD